MPNLTAIFKTSSFRTGRTPGIARSMLQACVLGRAPKLVLAPENNLLLVDNWTCTSRPITASQSNFLLSIN